MWFKKSYLTHMRFANFGKKEAIKMYAQSILPRVKSPMQTSCLDG